MEALFITADRQLHYVSQKLSFIIVLLFVSMSGLHTQYVNPQSTGYAQSTSSFDSSSSGYTHSTPLLDSIITDYTTSSLDTTSILYTEDSTLSLVSTSTEMTQSSSLFYPTGTDSTQSTPTWTSAGVEVLETHNLSTGQVCLFNSTALYCRDVTPLLIAVPADDLGNFMHLDFSNNAIKKVRENDFARYELLKILNLAWNNITFIQQNAFKNLYRLEVLNLEGNQLEVLDPSGLTFQHLVSLRWLNLQYNNITKINKNSFLTMAASSKFVSVDLDQNPVQCDCDIWSLKRLDESQAVKRVQINLMCNNGTQRVSYKEVKDYIFGSCTSQDDIFSGLAECAICANESSNYKCNLHRGALCLNNQMVCQKTVTWDESVRHMSIYSECVTYETCLKEEANNSETCGLGYKKNGNVNCNFCCRNQTCISNTIGGRTKDFTFFMIYMNSSNITFVEPVYLSWTNQIVNKIPSAISSIKGGIAVNVYTFIPQQNNQYLVVLQLHLTAFSIETVESVKDAIIKDLNENSSEVLLKKENLDSLMLSLYFEGMECNISNPICPNNMSCIEAEDGETRCLCDNSSYFKALAKACSPLTELQVKNLSASSTIDTVNLTWTARKYGARVSYLIQPSPNDGELVANSVSVNGGAWTSLVPGKEYNFIVLSTLHTDFCEKTVMSSISGVWTKFDYEMDCNTATDVCAAHMSCIPGLKGTTQCLCSDSSFIVPSTNICLPLTELSVEFLPVPSITNDTVTLLWKAKQYGTNVSYTIQPLPNKGHVVANSVGSNGGIWTGLDPGTQYIFNVISVLPANNFYAPKRVVSVTLDIWTKFPHGKECNISDHICTTGLNCIPNVNGKTQCLCDNSSFYVTSTKVCLPLAELVVKNLSTYSITSDTVILTWTANKHGNDVSYIIRPSPIEGHRVPNSVDDSRGVWADLYPGTCYNFTVSSVLSADAFYGQKYATAIITEVCTKVAKNFSIILSYMKNNATYQSLLEDPRSQKYLAEVRRILTGVKTTLSKTFEIMFISEPDFISLMNQKYKVMLKLEVTAFDLEKVEKGISEVIQTSIQVSNSFFFKEYYTFLEVSSNSTDSYLCPSSVTSKNTGIILWHKSSIGLQYVNCPYNDPLESQLQWASRECLTNTHGFSEWGAVNDSNCVTKEMQDNPDVEKIFERNITKGNSKIVSSLLRTYTNNSQNFTVGKVNKTVNLLEDLTSEEMLAQPDVAANVMDSVSNLISMDRNTLTKFEAETGASRRLLDIIDSVSNKAPLVGGRLKLMTPNLAVAAQAFNSKETQDITVVTDTDSGMRQNDSMVSIDFSTEDSKQSENRSGIIIPVNALLASLTPDEKNELKRISFAVHRSDILFATIIKDNPDKRASKTVTTTDSLRGSPGGSNSKKESDTVKKINSPVIYASVPGVKVQNLSTNVTISFEHTNSNATNPHCVFWDESLSQGNGAWSNEGCYTVESYTGRTTCGCNHLTNFALLMDVYEEGIRLSELDRKILSIISYVGCGISSLALILTLITYSLLKKLRRDNPSKILINLCLALLLSNLVFLIGMQDYAFSSTASCKAVAVLMHYFLLASLTWMAVEAFYMYLALVIVFKTYFTNFILKCALIGWGVPLVIVIITLAVNTTDNYGLLNSGLCWLKNPAFYGAFVGPVCLILFLNVLAFILVVKQLVNMSSTRLHKAEKNSTIQRLRGAIGVVILLGLSWLFAIFAIDQASVAFYYLFAVFNSLQGLFIFIFYCLLKNDAVISLKRSLPCFEEYGDTSKSYSNSKGVTAKAADHHLTERKSGSSKFSGNTKSTDSTVTGSRKDSCFSTLSSNGVFDDTESDRLQEYAETSRYTAASSLPEQLSKDIKDNVSTFTSKEMYSPARHFDSVAQEDCDPKYTNESTVLISDDPTTTYLDSSRDIHTEVTYGDTTLEFDSPSTFSDNTTQDTNMKATYENPTFESDNPLTFFDNTIKDTNTKATYGNPTFESDIPLTFFDNTIQDTNTKATYENLTFESDNPLTFFDNITQDTSTKVTVGNLTLESDDPGAYFDNTLQDTQAEVTYENITLESDNPDTYFDNTLQDIQTKATLGNTIEETHSSSRDFDYAAQDFYTDDTYQYRTPERQNSTSSKKRLENPIDSIDNQTDFYSDLPTERQIPTSSNLPYIVNEDYAQMEPPQTTSPDNAIQPDIPEYSCETDGGVNPAFTPFTADGEIDYSHTASVRDIRLKFEWSMSENSDKDVTKI